MKEEKKSSKLNRKNRNETKQTNIKPEFGEDGMHNFVFLSFSFISEYAMAHGLQHPYARNSREEKKKQTSTHITH